jgi:hypothetical protein
MMITLIAFGSAVAVLWGLLALDAYLWKRRHDAPHQSHTKKEQ